MTTEPNLAEQSPRSFRIDEELDLVLRSASFQGSKQCQALLRYLVEKSLGGQDGDASLKERTIGVEVFGRKPDYNTADDAIVRARVGEVRKRLAQYYLSPEGQGAAVEIVIPHGSYRPRFTFRAEKAGGSNEAPAIDQPHPAEPPHGTDEYPEPEAAAPVSGLHRPARWRTWGIAAVAACAVVVGAWVSIPRWTRSELDLFWAPFLESKKPTVIYMGTAPLYAPTAAFGEKMRSLIPPEEQKQPLTEFGPQPLAEGQVLTGNDVVVNRTDYVAADDITAVVDATRLLTAHRRSVELRSGSNLPFEDLRGSPVVLTGGGSNYWTLDMTRSLPFYLDRGLRIRERGGQGRVWSTPLWTPHTMTDDYAIVSRLVDSKTGAPMVILAGINSCGTRAAGEFVSDSAQLRALRNIPRDALEHKNIEFVLHATLVDCNPTSMDIVDMRYW